MPTRTFSCVVIALEKTAGHVIREAVNDSLRMELTRWVRDYPDETTLKRTLRISKPDLLVVDFSDLTRALRVVEVARESIPGVEILALCEERVRTLSMLQRAEIRQHVTPSHTVSQVNETLKMMGELMAERPPVECAGGDVFTFLPAKPGVGTSTIVANTAFLSSCGESRRTLLADFDQNAGVQSFLYKLQPERTLRDALSAAMDLNGVVWASLRSRVGNLDILPVDLDAGRNLEAAPVSRLLEFVRGAYDLTLVDLSGQLDPFALEAMYESKRVYVVCTQELACQHLLLKKVKQLRRSGVDGQLRLIVNRFQTKHVLTAERISQLVEVPVELTIGNHYELANAAGENGSPVRPDSELGRSYELLAGILAKRPVAAAKRRPRLFDYIAQSFMKASAETA